MLTSFEDCGATYWNDAFVHKDLLEQHPEKEDEIRKMTFLPVDPKNLEASVVEDVDFLRGNKLVREDLRQKVHGFLYDIKTGDSNRIR